MGLCQYRLFWSLLERCLNWLFHSLVPPRGGSYLEQVAGVAHLHYSDTEEATVQLCSRSTFLLLAAWLNAVMQKVSAFGPHPWPTTLWNLLSLIRRAHSPTPEHTMNEGICQEGSELHSLRPVWGMICRLPCCVPEGWTKQEFGFFTLFAYLPIYRYRIPTKLQQCKATDIAILHQLS